MQCSDQARGFTLLEMLVVLLIAGMALTLTTQALSQFQRAHDRATASERAGREHRLSEAWFRESVRGLYPPARHAGEAVRPGEDGVFSGTTDGFTGTTLSPVLAGQGQPVVQTWRISRDPGGRARLSLEEAGQLLTLSLPGEGDLRLHYLDGEGDIHDQWPPRLGTWKQVPDAVLLELDAGTGDSKLVVAAVLGPGDPLTPLERAFEYAPL